MFIWLKTELSVAINRYTKVLINKRQDEQKVLRSQERWIRKKTPATEHRDSKAEKRWKETEIFKFDF